MKELREQVEKTQKDLTEKLFQLNEEVNHQFMLLNKTLDKLEGSNKDIQQSDEVSIKVQEAIIERLKKGVLTSDDVINIMDNYLEKGERFNLLDKLYERHYNLNPQSLNITD